MPIKITSTGYIFAMLVLFLSPFCNVKGVENLSKTVYVSILVKKNEKGTSNYYLAKDLKKCSDFKTLASKWKNIEEKYPFMVKVYSCRDNGSIVDKSVFTEMENSFENDFVYISNGELKSQYNSLFEQFSLGFKKNWVCVGDECEKNDGCYVGEIKDDCFIICYSINCEILKGIVECKDLECFMEMSLGNIFCLEKLGKEFQSKPNERIKLGLVVNNEMKCISDPDKIKNILNAPLCRSYKEIEKICGGNYTEKEINQNTHPDNAFIPTPSDMCSINGGYTVDNNKGKNKITNFVDINAIDEDYDYYECYERKEDSQITPKCENKIDNRSNKINNENKDNTKLEKLKNEEEKKKKEEEEKKKKEEEEKKKKEEEEEKKKKEEEEKKKKEEEEEKKKKEEEEKKKKEGLEKCPHIRVNFGKCKRDILEIFNVKWFFNYIKYFHKIYKEIPSSGEVEEISKINFLMDEEITNNTYEIYFHNTKEKNFWNTIIFGNLSEDDGHDTMSVQFFNCTFSGDFKSLFYLGEGKLKFDTMCKFENLSNCNFMVRKYPFCFYYGDKKFEITDESQLENRNKCIGEKIRAFLEKCQLEYFNLNTVKGRQRVDNSKKTEKLSDDWKFEDLENIYSILIEKWQQSYPKMVVLVPSGRALLHVPLETQEGFDLLKTYFFNGKHNILGMCIFALPSDVEEKFDFNKEFENFRINVENWSEICWSFYCLKTSSNKDKTEIKKLFEDIFFLKRNIRKNKELKEKIINAQNELKKGIINAKKDS